MRNIDEQLKAVEIRAEVLKEKKERQNAVLKEAGLAAICLLIIAVTPLAFNRLMPGGTVPEITAYGSVVAFSSYASYILIGTLAFILGISFTLLCLQISRRKGRRR